MGGRKVSMAERLSRYVVNENGCWIWPGAKTVDGYGRIRGSENGVICSVRAHRASFAYHVRQIAAGEYICHHCDRPSCINPEHLYAGDPATNGADKARRSRAKTRPRFGADNPVHGRNGTLNPFFGCKHTSEAIAQMLETRKARRPAR